MQATREDYARRNANDNLEIATLDEFASSFAIGSFAMKPRRELRNRNQERNCELPRELLLRDKHGAANLGDAIMYAFVNYSRTAPAR